MNSGDNVRIALEDKFREILTQKGKSRGEFNPLNQKDQMISRTNYKELNRTNEKVSKPKSHISEVSSSESALSYATERKQQKVRDYEMLCPPCINKDLAKFNTKKIMNQNEKEYEQTLDNVKADYLNIYNQEMKDQKPKAEFINNIKNSLSISKVSPGDNPVNTLVTNGLFTDYKYFNAIEKQKKTEDFATKADYTYEQLKFPTSW